TPGPLPGRGRTAGNRRHIFGKRFPLSFGRRTTGFHFRSERNDSFAEPGRGRSRGENRQNPDRLVRGNDDQRRFSSHRTERTRHRAGLVGLTSRSHARRREGASLSLGRDRRRHGERQAHGPRSFPARNREASRKPYRKKSRRLASSRRDVADPSQRRSR